VKLTKYISKSLTLAIALSVLFALVAFTEYKASEKRCIDVSVEIPKIEGEHIHSDIHFFIDKKDIIDLITFKGREPLKERKLEHFNVHEVEELIKTDRFVDGVEVFKTLKGEVKIKVTQRRPMVRMIRKDSSFYISDQGVILPLSNRFSARVPLLLEKGKSFYFTQDTVISPRDEELKEFLSIVDHDEFLNKLISQIIIDEEGRLEIIPQLSRQKIYWGKPTDTESKVERLKIVYKKILPSKGWNKYKTVNLSYKDQIICE
jgi:cell division protein FtsQ